MRLLRSICSLLRPFWSPVAAPRPIPSFVPVFKANFPDAFVLLHGSEFIAYATNNGPNVPMARSTDLVHWTFVGDPAERQPSATRCRSSEAGPRPASPGRRKCSSSAASICSITLPATVEKNAQCIGVAVASRPEGPFVDTHPEPIVCQTELGGSIDASPFRDADGKLYLYFKNDGNRVHARTSLWGQPLAADGLSVTGEPQSSC